MEAKNQESMPIDLSSLFFNDPQFLRKIALHFSHTLPKEGLASLLDLEEEMRLSLQIEASGIQNSANFRYLRRARKIAAFLIDEKGEINGKHLTELIGYLQTQGHLFYADGYDEGVWTSFVLRFLVQLRDLPSIGKLIRKFQMPVCHAEAESLVRQTLGLLPPHPLNDPLLKTAVLTAALSPLRQNVGSCFATAPAILIQKEQVEKLLEDLYQLLFTGKLKRVFEGIEYTVPLSRSTGVADLRQKIEREDVHLAQSPGLLAAFDAAGLTPISHTNASKHGQSIASDFENREAANMNLHIGNKRFTKDDVTNCSDLPQECEKWGLTPESLLQQKKGWTPEKLLHEALLQQYQLTDEDLLTLDRFEREALQRSKLAPLSPAQGNSKKIELCQRLKQKEEMAKAAFKALTDNALLKAWEFTLASLSDVKMEFSQWNLYISLGLAPEEKGGVGEVIYRYLDEKLKEMNGKIQECQREYEIAFDQLKGTEILLKQASSESEIRRLRAEFQSRAYHMQMCLEMRDRHLSKGSHYSSLYPFLMKQYEEKFPEYFQEIYDPEMQEFKGDIYDDSPAGFRLVCKHGRSDPSQWTLVDTSEQYIDALIEFFLGTESPIAIACDWEGGESAILEVTSAVILHLRTEEFLSSALMRTAKAHVVHGVSEEGALPAKPWVYISGGTMTTLLKTYYHRSAELTQEAQWVESESELLIFLIDTLKNLSPVNMDPYLKDPSKGMLASSPSHAFTLFPGIRQMREGWQESGFTYTWVRDQIFLPSQQFYARMKFNASEQLFLIDAFSGDLPPLLSHDLHRFFTAKEEEVSVAEFREALLSCLLSAATLQEKRKLSDAIDSFLFRMLPLIPSREYKIYLRRLFADRMDEKIEQAMEELPSPTSSYLSAKSVKEAAKGVYLLAHPQLALSFDLHAYIAEHARYVSLSAPSPLVFADTNWAHFSFAFLVNPGTGRLELWRVDPTATEGAPMRAWAHWLNGTDRKPWVLFTRSSEY